MHIKHNYPMAQMTFDEVEELDNLLSESMDLFFRLESKGVEDAQAVLLKGTYVPDASH